MNHKSDSPLVLKIGMDNDLSTTPSIPTTKVVEQDKQDAGDQEVKLENILNLVTTLRPLDGRALCIQVNNDGHSDGVYEVKEFGNIELNLNLSKLGTKSFAASNWPKFPCPKIGEYLKLQDMDCKSNETMVQYRDRISTYGPYRFGKKSLCGFTVCDNSQNNPYNKFCSLNRLAQQVLMAIGCEINASYLFGHIILWCN